MSYNNNFTLAEKSIIGALLINQEAISEVCDYLRPEMFKNSVLGCAYEGCLNSYQNGRVFDAVTVAQNLKEASFGFDEQDAFEIVKECALSTATSTNIKEHARVVVDDYIPRLCNERMKDIQNHPELATQMILDLNKQVLDITQSSGKGSLSVPDIVSAHKDEYFREKVGKRLKMDIDCLDEITGDLEAGDIFVIGARPAVGKSALALQILNGLSHNGNKIGYFNLEMTEKQVFERMVASESGIGLTRIRRAVRFLNDEEEKYTKACERLSDKSKIYVSTGSKTSNQIRSEVEREHFDAIVIDYLQLIKPSGIYGGNRQAEVGYISHSLKAIAVDFKIPIILLSQLNRESEGTATKKPKMSELRESGDIENDASIILLLWNKDEDDRTKKGYCFSKNRQGNLGEGELIFNGDLMKFYGENDFIDITPSMELDIPF